MASANSEPQQPIPAASHSAHAVSGDELRRAAERWRRTWVEIDLAALRRNVARFAYRLPSGAKLIAAVKKDAYGHGLLEITRALAELPVIGAVGVATIEEALTLATHECPLPILLFAMLEGDALAEAIRQDVTLTVTDIDDALEAHNTARRMGLVAHAHFKIDTGMGRLGRLVDEVADQMTHIRQLENLRIEAIYSHMADAWSNPQSARDQWKRMETFRLRAGVGMLPYHWGGSDALILKELLGPKRWLRSGIALYGDHPSASDLEPVMTFKSRVIYRRTVPAGTAISYGGTYTTTRPTELALVGVGYGNGLPRVLGNRAQVLLRGRRCPLLGRVCMDQVAVDVTDLHDVRVGEEAVFFGRQGDALLPVAEVAAQAGTISYELMCLAGQLNPREFIETDG